ncbi:MULTISPECIES: flavodoxin domain-containing protein [Amycolatopsis]|uniref:Menaquinone-dependent protoporphyrinogen oxidase n=2 Tax=Amycolatopsis TaxID=1813 RepID=A0A1I3JVQ4_9PSEU|nr:flavodoxin domain-containing protein [Amycolatopsis sacchari]SFI64357.1 menaquinone-dependent protoporphyrinogen oxidase [Amycolatopsis sacchari]
MKVLVTVGSRHGATLEIADEIGRRLREALTLLGELPEVDVRPAVFVAEVDEYHAVVLGSSVYHGRWVESARELAEREHEALVARPVWLFSSGACGSPPAVRLDGEELTRLRELTGAHQHRAFIGALDWRRLDPGELSEASAVASSGGFGDYRNWPEFRHWADTIATTLWAATALDPHLVG